MTALLGRRLGSLEDILSSLEGADKALAFLSYSSKILAFFLARRYPRRDWATRAQSFYGSVEDARIIYRLFGLIANIRFLLSFRQAHRKILGEEEQQEKDKKKKGPWHPLRMISFLTHMQNFSLLVCNPLEHAAWFASNIFELREETSAKWDRWSCMAWSAWIVLEVVLHLYKYWMKVMKVKELEGDKGLNNEEVKVGVAQCRRKQSILASKVLSNVTELPIALNWSFEEEPLPDVMVGVFGAMSSLIGFIMLYTKYDHDDTV